jgi:hypothetical protein
MSDTNILEELRFHLNKLENDINSILSPTYLLHVHSLHADSQAFVSFQLHIISVATGATVQLTHKKVSIFSLIPENGPQNYVNDLYFELGTLTATLIRQVEVQSPVADREWDVL